MIDTDLVGKGIGIAFVGIGAGIALGAMKDLIDEPRKKSYTKSPSFSYKPYNYGQMPKFKPIKWKF